MGFALRNRWTGYLITLVSATLLGLLAMAALAADVGAQSTAILRVDDDSTASSPDGSSWSNAYADLQAALTAADTALSGSADSVEVWVAAGTYYPTSSTDRNVSFELRNNVEIYGGFPAGGGQNGDADLSDRDWQTHETILSGDIGTSGDDTDNSYTVVLGENTDDTPVLDGFSITGGNASSSTIAQPMDSGGGIYLKDSDATLTNLSVSGNSALLGGGMFLEFSDATLTNLSVTGNLADHNGGGMILYASDATLTNLSVAGNSAGYRGGGIFLNGSDATLTNLSVTGNSANYGGGGMALESSDDTLTNLSISGNSAGAHGGGGMLLDSSDATLTNLSVTGNSADDGGGVMIDYGSDATLTNVSVTGNSATAGDGGGMLLDSAFATLTNLSVAGNSAGNEGGGILLESSNSTLTNSIVWGNSASSDTDIGIVRASPTITDVIVGQGCEAVWTDCSSADPLFVDWIDPSQSGWAPTSDGDYRLLPGSPAIDAGDDSAVPSGVTTDLDGNNRFVGTVDLGAYESPYLTLRVDDDNTATSPDGTTWANAYADLQAALTAADTALSGSADAVEIWVAAGTYYPTSSTDRNVSFELRNNVEIYGGFPTGGGQNGDADLSDRDWQTHATILSGDIGVSGDDTDNSYSVVRGENTDDTPVLDGFTITGGNANASTINQPMDTGGGVYLSQSNTTLTNLAVTGNSADGAGGMYVFESNATLANLSVSDNSASYGGGMVLVFSDATLTNLSIRGNSAGTNGGGVFLHASDATLTNLSVSGNAAGYGGYSGGGMLLSGSDNATLTNLSVSGNAAYLGGGVVFDNSDATLTNSIVWGNSTSSGGDIGTNLANPTIADVIVGQECEDGWTDCSSADPLFVDWIDPSQSGWTPTSAGDYRLLPGSPAIDAGDDSAVPSGVTTDLAGNNRFVNTVDLGAYEAQFSNAQLSLSAPASSEVGTNAQVTVALSADNIESALLDASTIILTGHNGPTEIDLDANGKGSALVTTTTPGTMDLTATLGTLSDTATLTWVPGPPDDVQLVASPQPQAVEGDVSLTATVTDQYGNAVAENTEVTFDISGSTSEAPTRTDGGSGWTALTDANGEATLSYTRTFPASDTVTASAGDSPVVTSDDITVQWTAPASTPNSSISIRSSRGASLMLNLSVDGAGNPSGSINYSGRPYRFSTGDILSVAVNGDSAVIYAEADVRRGQTEVIRIDLEAGGRAGTARIQWPGYDSGELRAGRISIR